MPPASSVTGSEVGLTQVEPMTRISLIQTEPMIGSGVHVTQAEPMSVQAQAFHGAIKKETLWSC